MAATSENLSYLISSIWDAIGNPPEYSLAYISGWVFDQSNVGRLNNLIDTCFAVSRYTGVSGVTTGIYISPELNPEEQSIYKLIFDVFYYQKQSKAVMSGAGGLTAWQSLREGDTTIVRVNRSEMAKTYRALGLDSRKALEDEVRKYLRNQGVPAQVAGDDDEIQPYYHRGDNPRVWPDRYW